LVGLTIKNFVVSFAYFFSFYSPDNFEKLPFYLKPKTKWTPGTETWFERSPIGHNTLDKRFKTICKEANLEGNFSNHSGRVTAITRMYEAGLPEKEIMKRSGHRSIEGVRTYQREDPNEIVRVSGVLSSSSSTITEQSDTVDDDLLLVKACEEVEKNTSGHGIAFGSINLQGANNVNININITK